MDQSGVGTLVMANAYDGGHGDVFFYQNDQSVRETPDLKIIQEHFVYGISTPRILTTKTLGDVLGGESISGNRKEVEEYVVQPGDTVESVAAQFAISANTVRWANDLAQNSSLKAGQTLVILPVSGVSYVVKAGDTLSDIARKGRQTGYSPRTTGGRSRIRPP